MGRTTPDGEERARFASLATDVRDFAERMWGASRVCAVNYLRGTLRGPLVYEVRLDEGHRERATIVFVRRNPDATFAVVDTSHP